MIHLNYFKQRIPIEWLDPLLGYGKGDAVANFERPIPGKDKVEIFYLVYNSDDKPITVNARYVLPEK